MASRKFKLEHGFYEELHRRLERQRNIENASYASGLRKTRSRWLVGLASKPLYQPETIPSISHLEELVEISFWASLKQEEGRKLHFTLKYVPEPWREFSLCFSEPMRFNVSNLRKLGPALSMDHTCITPSKKDGQLEICEITTAMAEPVSSQPIFQTILVCTHLNAWN